MELDIIVPYFGLVATI